MQTSENSIIDALFHYLSIIISRKWIIIIVTGVITLGTIIFAIISIKLPPEKSPLPNLYTAEAILFVQPNEQSNISDSILSALGMDQQNRQTSNFNNGDMILEILRSRTIIDELLEEFNIFKLYNIPKEKKTEARLALLANLKYSYARNTGILKLSFTDTDPIFACNVANRIVELLDEWFALNRGLAKQKIKLTLEQKLIEVKADIESLQERLKRLQSRYGVLSATELGASQAASLSNLRSQLILKEIELKNYSIYSGISDPRLEQLNKELENLRELISKNQTTIPDLNQDSGRQRTIADVALEFSQLTNELDIQQRIFNTLSPQYEAMKLSPETESIFQIFELAEVPDVKTGPQRSLIVIIAFGGGLGLSIGFVLLSSFMIEWKKKYLK